MVAAKLHLPLEQSSPLNPTGHLHCRFPQSLRQVPNQRKEISILNFKGLNKLSKSFVFSKVKKKFMTKIHDTVEMRGIFLFCASLRTSIQTKTSIQTVIVFGWASCPKTRMRISRENIANYVENVLDFALT